MGEHAVQIEYTATARVTVAGRPFRLERSDSGIWISGGFFREAIEAAALEDASTVLAAVATQLRERPALEERGAG